MAAAWPHLPRTHAADNEPGGQAWRRSQQSALGASGARRLLGGWQQHGMHASGPLAHPYQGCLAALQPALGNCSALGYLRLPGPGSLRLTRLYIFDFC